MARQLTEQEIQHFIEHPEEVDATDTELVEALASAELAVLGVKEDDPAVAKAPKTEPDPADAEAKQLAEQAIKDAEAQAAKEDAEAKAKAEADAKAKAEAQAKGKAGDESAESDEGKRVLSKNGEATLPYAVLKGEREARAGAEAALAEAQRTILAYADRIKALEAGRADPGDGEAKSADELQALLDEVGEQAPWLKGPMEKLIGKVNDLTGKISEYEQERTETEAEAQARLQAEANAAFEGNATLVLWRSTAPELYQEAVQFDHVLREDTRFTSFDARYARVVELVKASHAGETIPLPEPVKAPNPPAKDTKAQPSAAEIKARADKALKEAEDATAVRTLTDVPGGEGEVTTEEQLSRMSVMDLAERMRNWTPQQVIDFARGA